MLREEKRAVTGGTGPAACKMPTVPLFIGLAFVGMAR